LDSIVIVGASLVGTLLVGRTDTRLERTLAASRTDAPANLADRLVDAARRHVDACDVARLRFR
jgi:hypothetical protein